MNDIICPVIFQEVKDNSFPKFKHGRLVNSEDDGKSQKQIARHRAQKKKYWEAVLMGQKVPKEPAKSADKRFEECKIVLGPAINEITIKSILPDWRVSAMREWETNPGADNYDIDIESEINKYSNDTFGINVLIDQNYMSAAVLAYKKIKAITIRDKWREPDKILKRSLWSTPTCAWTERMAGTGVSIELTDGTILPGQINPCGKQYREEIEQLENAQKVSKTEDKYRKNLPDAKRGHKNVVGGHTGGVISAKNRIAKRGDCIENHRKEFDRLCKIVQYSGKTMTPRSAAMRMAKQSKCKFHPDAIARHFRQHPTPPNP